MVEEKLEKFNSINLYVEIENEHGMTFPAVFKDLALHIQHKADFKKVAVVTDKTTLQKFVDLKDAFLNTEIRSFPIEERIDAMNWVMI